jgi:NADP-reducing hydrogenase subunit HndB
MALRRLDACQPSTRFASHHSSRWGAAIGLEGLRFMNIQELQKLKERAQRHLALRGARKKYRVVFSMGTAAIAAGARTVMATALDELEKRGIDHVEVVVSGEMGLCVQEPVVRVEDKRGETVTYAKVTPAAARQIVAEHLEGDKIVVGLAVGKVKESPEGK